MTVGELIHALDCYDEDLEICLRSNEELIELLGITTQLQMADGREVVFIEVKE
jgi:hypothetical protein